MIKFENTEVLGWEAAIRRDIQDSMRETTAK